MGAGYARFYCIYIMYVVTHRVRGSGFYILHSVHCQVCIRTYIYPTFGRMYLLHSSLHCIVGWGVVPSEGDRHTRHNRVWQAWICQKGYWLVIYNISAIYVLLQWYSHSLCGWPYVLSCCWHCVSWPNGELHHQLGSHRWKCSQLRMYRFQLSTAFLQWQSVAHQWLHIGTCLLS